DLLASAARSILTQLGSWSRFQGAELDEETPDGGPADGGQGPGIAQLLGSPSPPVAVFVQVWDRFIGEDRAWVAWAPTKKEAVRTREAFHKYREKDSQTISRFLRDQ